MATQVTPIAPPGKPLSSILTKDHHAPWRSSTSLSSSSTLDCTSTDEKLNTTAEAFDVLAQNIQFVASPGETRKLQSILPGAIREAFRFVPAFAGCMVMVSDQEARRVSIVALWKGKERARHCSENAERMRMLLFPYVDHWLRAENHITHLSLSSETEEPSKDGRSASSTGSTVNA